MVIYAVKIITGGGVGGWGEPTLFSNKMDELYCIYCLVLHCIICLSAIISDSMILRVTLKYGHVCGQNDHRLGCDWGSALSSNKMDQLYFCFRTYNV